MRLRSKIGKGNYKMKKELQTLKSSLKAFDVLTEDEIDDFIQFFKSKKINKANFFIKEGEICQEIAFIVSGTFRSFYISKQGEEITSCIKFPGCLMTAYSSFISGESTFVNMQAITSSELLIVQKKVMDDLTANNLNWMKFSKIIAEQNFIELEKRAFQFQVDNALERYSDLVKDHPEIIQCIPLQYVASYLGITQRHLSRIRKELKF